MDEIAVYTHRSNLNDYAIPDLIQTLSRLGLQTKKVPNKIIFRSRWTKPGHFPDETLTLLSIKKNNPSVEFSKLERLYNRDMLSKFIWKEYFEAEDINWRELLVLCNTLVERSATDFNVFLRFSLMDEETLELITN